MRRKALVLALATALPAQTLDPPPVPVENPSTPDKVNLGKALFWDEQLSASKTVACATCHVPEAGGSDPRAAAAVHPGFDGLFATGDDVHGSFGVVFMAADGRHAFEPTFGLGRQVTHRKAPSVLMAAYDPELFWDGRAPQQLFDPSTGQLVIARGAALERQALEPFLSEVEMTETGTEWPVVLERVRRSQPLALAAQVPPRLARWIAGRSYPALFAQVFGSQAVTPVRIAMAIAAYERSLVPDAAPIDRHLAGDPGALTAEESAGMSVFDAHCAVCHPAPTFGGTGFFNIGVRPPVEDAGRGAISRRGDDHGAFKVPSLRNVAQRAPFFHNGSQTSLADVVAFYDRGGDFAENRSSLIVPLHLGAAEQAALVAFLGRPLTDPRAAAGAPPFDHPRLFADTRRAPRTFGFGTAGSQGRVPVLLAAEPPALGNAEFRMALDDGLATAPAVLLLDLAPGRRSLLGVTLWLGLTPALQELPLGLLLHGSGGGQGWTSWILPLPAEPTLDGLEVFAQAIVLDAGGPRGLSASAGARWRLFATR